MTFDLEKYKRLFITETKEHLENITKILEKAKNTLDEEEINTIFREAHSIKGMAAAMGYQFITEVAHNMENIMQEIRSKKNQFNEAIKDTLISATDKLWKKIEEIEAGEQKETTTTSLQRGQEEREENAQNIKVFEPVSIEIFFAENVPSIFARAFLVYKNIESFGMIKKSEPTIDEIKKGVLGNCLKILLIPSKPIEPLLSYLSKVKEIAAIHCSALEKKDDTVKIEASSEPREQKSDDRLVLPRSVKVDITFLDNFVNITGELLTIKARIEERTKNFQDIEIANALNQMEIFLKDMQQKVMHLRLMPLETIFSRIPRVVRDLSRKLDKKVDIEIYGENIELDRAVVEALFDPLLHIIRNSVDHGIEAPEEREKKGKTPSGKIIVAAEKEKENIIVKICDDGKGIDAELVFKKAKESGKFSEEFLASLKTRKDKLYLVTAPGVTTKATVSDISGRGVGLDVVKSTIESLGGGVDIDSEEDRGTTITLSLPSSLSIVNVLLFKLDEYLFGTPVDKIIRILKVKRENIKVISENSYTLFYNDEHIPLYFLHDYFKIEKKNIGDDCAVILISIKGILTAVVVDDFVGHKEVYLRPLNPPLSFIPGFYSSTILGDGSPTIILDIQGVKFG